MKIQEEFLDKLKWSIEETERKNLYTPSKTYKPSSMKCIRNMFFQVKGVTPDISDKRFTLVGIAKSGTDIHLRIQQDVIDMMSNGIDCEYIDVEKYILDNHLDKDIEIKGKSGIETRLYSPKYNISFMCDGIIRFKDKYYIIEFKTETSLKFNGRFSVAEEHQNQAIAYSLLFNIDDVLFVYISRDNLDMKAFMYSPTLEEKEKLISKINECNDYLSLNQVPPKPHFEEYENVCKYCQYKNTCNLY